jgi:hypothetical protein
VADESAPRPAKGAPVVRAKPLPASGPRWTASHDIDERDGSYATARSPRSDRSAEDTRAHSREALAQPVDPGGTRQRDGAREDPRAGWLGAAPGSGSVDPDRGVAVDAGAENMAPSPRESYRVRTPEGGRPAQGMERRGVEGPGPDARAPQRIYVERLPRAPDSTTQSAAVPVPYTGAPRGYPAPLSQAPGSAPMPYTAPRSPQSAPPPARAPERSTNDRSGGDDLRGGSTRERDR